MHKVLLTKPKSTFIIKDNELTYEQIQSAILNNFDNRFLQGIITTCQNNPNDVIIMVYIAYSDKVLMIFGKKPNALIINGDKLKQNLESSSKKGYLYVFTHSK